jgi:uncharacterized membrane protein YfhO
MKDLSFKKGLLYFSIILLALELIVYRDFIFGDYLFIFKDLGDDSYVSGYPILYSKIQALKLGEIPSWSFNNGLGENLYPFWLEPIALFIAFVFFKNDVAASMIWIQLAYSFLAGILFFSFLRGFKYHFLPSMIFGILYVFSGYMMLHSTWMHLEFSNTIMMFAFLLFSWQRYVFSKQWFYFPIAIALLAISYTPVNLYFGTFLVGILMLLQIHSHYEGVWKKWVIDITKLGLLGAVGLGMSCFMLLSNLNIMLNSPRGSGAYDNGNLESLTGSFQISSFTEIQTSFLRLFSPNLQGITDDYSGWLNYFEAPIWYSGLIVLILIPQLFHFLNKREKIIHVSVLLFFFLIAIFPKLRLIVWFYSGNYYRVISLLFCVIALYYSAKALDHIIRKKVVYLKTLWVSMGMLILLLVLQTQSIVVDASPNIYVIIFFLLSYTGLLWYWNGQNKKAISLIGGAIFFEILLFTSPTLGDRKIITEEDVKTGVGYKDATINAVADIKNESTGFFRIEKDYFSGVSRDASYNEAKIQNYFGSRTYNSFSNVNYINFLNCMEELGEDKEASTRWVDGVSGSTNAMRLCSVKYLLTTAENIDKYKSDFGIQNENRNVKTLKLKNSLPFGFTYDTYIDGKDFQKLKKSEKQRLILNTVLIDETILPSTDFIKKYYPDNNAIVSQRDTLTEIVFTNDKISALINSKQTQLLFFSIPFNDGWNLIIDGENTKLHLVFEGLMGAFITKGNHTIELEFEDSYKTRGTIISIVSLLVYILLIFTAYFKPKFNFLPKSNI